MEVPRGGKEEDAHKRGRERWREDVKGNGRIHAWNDRKKSERNSANQWFNDGQRKERTKTKGGFPVLARSSSQLAASACMSTFIQSQC